MSTSPAIRILLVDDRALVRAGIRALVQGFQGMEVVAEAASGSESLELTGRHSPQVVLMDIAMPGLNGLEALERFRSQFPEVRVIIVSVHTEEEFVLRAVGAGAAGYVSKNGSPGELELAIRAAARGETYLSPPVARFVMGDYLKRVGLTATRPVDRLTSRQREILQLIAEGASTKEIAAKLHLSVNTVDAHRGKLMQVLDIHDIAGLVRFAIRTGIISAGE